MDILPILATLRRHKITALLIVLEIALTCAIVCNAVFLIAQRMHRMDMPSGVAEHELVQVQVATIGAQPDSRARTQEDLAALRAIPGVESVTLTNQLPFTNSSWNSSIELTATQTQPTLSATLYRGEHLPQTLGARLVAGRYFQPDEYVYYEDVQHDPKSIPRSSLIVVITQALAQRLWPGRKPARQDDLPRKGSIACGGRGRGPDPAVALER
jgi:putative ABC transport system permease protein